MKMNEVSLEDDKARLEELERRGYRLLDSDKMGVYNEFGKKMKESVVQTRPSGEGYTITQLRRWEKRKVKLRFGDREQIEEGRASMYLRLYEEVHPLRL